MVCIYCNGKTKVTNVRPQARLKASWRRRQCLVCGAIFTSTEHIDLASSVRVAKRNGDLEPFNTDKLFMSIYQACQPKNDALSTARALTDTVLAGILKELSHPIINSIQIAAICHPILKRYSKTIAQRYWSYQLEK